MLENKRILLGVTGSIAAYKAAHLVRLLVKAGATVKVIMTPDAFEFITPLTLGTLSKNPVLSAFSSEKDGTWTNHVELGLWADLMLIAPATANTLAKMASGICDNLLLATYLSARCPVWVAPAMDLDMYLHPATQHNLETLSRHGIRTIDPEEGELASGLNGKGRLAEPEHILEAIQHYFNRTGRLQGKKVLVSAGPTREAIDPVRYISNHSSGKMGYALAEALCREGAEVTLVSGPTQLRPPEGLKQFIPAESARDMETACLAAFPGSDLCIMSAAVADYRPVQPADQKIKKQDQLFQLELEKTTDILQALGQQKKPGQILCGFALETNNEEQHALDKLRKKNLDLIVLNSLQDKGAGFGVDTNQVKILFSNNPAVNLPLEQKTKIAQQIVDAICEKFYS